MVTNELKSSRINIHLCSKMYKKVTSKYVVIAKSYHQVRGKNLTFFVEKPCNYQQIGKLTSLRGKLSKPAVPRV